VPSLTVVKVYRELLHRFGPQDWWPAKTSFDVILGAILTQRTRWENAAEAVRKIRSAGLDNPKALADAPLALIRRLTKGAGFRAKARWIRDFADYVVRNYAGDVNKLLRRPLLDLRTELLSLDGIGKETADSIILYAAAKPILPVDAYTRRITARTGLAQEGAGYEDIRILLESALPKEVEVYKEFHALLVKHAKTFCLANPRCSPCPITDCAFGAGKRGRIATIDKPVG